MPSLDAGTSTPKRGIRTMLASIRITSVRSLRRNSSLRPYELPTSLLRFSKQAPSSMSSNSMPISSPLSPPIYWLPSICPPPNQPPLVGQSTPTVSSVSTTVSMSPTPTTSAFVFFTTSTITPSPDISDRTGLWNSYAANTPGQEYGLSSKSTSPHAPPVRAQRFQGISHMGS